jgi:hypothetical protein
MTQPTLNIEFEECRDQITIKIGRKHPSDIFSGKLTPKKWEQFCNEVDKALRIICRARSRSRALDVMHVIMALVLVIAQFVAYIGKMTKDYEIFCTDRLYQQFICNWFRSDLSWIPVFLISYVVLAIVLLVCIRRCIFKRSRRVFIARINELCTQLSSTSPDWKFSLCPPGFSGFSSVKFCSIKIERVIPSIEINTMQDYPVTVQSLAANAFPCDQKGEPDGIYGLAVQV